METYDYIKTKHLFHENFDLEKRLIDVVRISAYLKSLYQEISTRKEIRTKTDKLLKLMTELISELESTPDEIQAYLNRFAKYPIDTITESEHPENVNFESYLKDSKLIAQAAQLILSKLPPNKSGASPDISKKDIIRLLIDIFEKGTGKTVITLKKNGRKNLYLDKNNKKEIVDFIVDAEHLLVKIGIIDQFGSLGEESTISETVNEILEEWKRFSK